MNFREKISGGDWSLFLDRDGVINRQVIGGYVLDISQFEFLPGVTEAIPVLNGFFREIFIVTNQQCIGKGLLDNDGLNVIHNYMVGKIVENGGYITDIFVSPHLDTEEHPSRKPSAGMAYQAADLYPGIKLSQSVMAGDSTSDMLFGRNAGMINILIGSGNSVDTKLYEHRFDTLFEFALSLALNKG